MIPERAKFLIEELNLLPHPEGGFYKETYRSKEKMGSPERNLMTTIYFLITGGNISRFHRIKSDEGWYFHEGNGLTVHLLTKEEGHEELKLGLSTDKNEFPFQRCNFWFVSYRK